MLKTGYALVRAADGAVAQSFHDTTVDENNRPSLRFMVPGADLDVHCPEVGAEFGGYVFVEQYMNDPGAPSQWNSWQDQTAFDGQKIVTTRVYSKTQDIVPQPVTPLQMRRALRQAGIRDQVEAYVATLDPDAKDAWEYAAEVRRDNAIIASGAVALNLSPAQVDDLFRLAASL